MRWAAAVLALVGATALSVRPVRPVTPRRTVTCVAPGKVELKQKVSLKTTANPGGGGTDDGEREREFERKNVEDLEDPKMFNVILLGDEDYTQEHICKALLDVVEDVQIKQAEEIFLEAQKGGQANVCTTSQELAEHYVQQLARKDPMIFCEMKEAPRSVPRPPCTRELIGMLAPPGRTMLWWLARRLSHAGRGAEGGRQ